MTKPEITANAPSGISIIPASKLFRHSSFVVGHSDHVYSRR